MIPLEGILGLPRCAYRLVPGHPARCGSEHPWNVPLWLSCRARGQPIAGRRGQGGVITRYGFKLMPTCLAAKLRLAITSQRRDVREQAQHGLHTCFPPALYASAMLAKPTGKRATAKAGDWCNVGT